ncbi:hypothetical protein K9L97_01565 [Candidatus Woesearchaeota archaeon]|nr:hypothetical protein [Candidatus Woesearchaeota archaeon]
MEDKENQEEELNIDFESIKKKTQKITRSISNLFKAKYAQTALIIIFLILIITISAFYRLYPATLPVTDIWAKDTVANNIKNQIASQIQQTNPGITQDQLIAQANQQYASYYTQNKESLDSQIQTLSQQYKSQLQNENGQTYLLAIDPYLWYSYAKWYEKTGFYGNEIVDGIEKFTLRNGRIGEIAGVIYPSAAIVFFHKIIQILNPSQDILATSFLMPVILIGLAIIPAFFLGKKIGGLGGGIFAATLFALSSPILGRTAAGFSDTDAYTFIFPFLILWVLIEAIDAKTQRNKIILSALTGLLIALFMFFWSGWWFTFDFMIGVTIIYIAFQIIKHLIKHKKKPSLKETYKITKPGLTILAILIISTIVFSFMFATISGRTGTKSVMTVLNAPIEPLNFILGFKGAAEGVSVGSGLNYPLWPNVFTTVAELNPGSPQQIINGGGGKTLVYAAILGIILLLFRKKDGHYEPLLGIILIAWFASTYYAGLIGIRFIALFAPVVAFGIAGLIGSLTGERMKNIAKKTNIPLNLTRAIILIAAFFIIVYPQFAIAHQTSINEIPSYDDVWDSAMKTIQNTSEKAIISSWWDFGHWFEAMSERSVTFDGGDQGKRIHWIGNTLLNPNEKEAIETLKMLNCGQEESYNLLEIALKDKYQATKTLKKIILQNKEEARKTLIALNINEENISQILEYTHCSDLYDMYYITSGDMVGKAGVWGHFGSWDFDKAYMYYKLKNMPIDKAIQEAQDTLGLTQEEAKSTYIEMQSITNENQAAAWISPWPNYVTTNPITCQEQNNSIVCDYNLNIGNQNGAIISLYRGVYYEDKPEESFIILRAINPNTGTTLSQNMIKPQGLAFSTKDEIKKTEFETPGIGYDVLIYEENSIKKSLIMHPLLTESLFTKLFYLDGKHTEHFEKIFDQQAMGEGRVIVWKVNP